ncbi:MAG: DUF5684 domain-containing protein [Phycisphaeraceae bacterium]
MIQLILAQYDNGGDAGGLFACCCSCAIPLTIFLAVFVLAAVGLFKLFTKANKPGWAAFIPVYNGMVMAEIVGRPSWHGLLLLVPVLGVIMAILICIELAKSFGKDTVFGVLLALFSPIMMPILGFSSATYSGPVRDPNNTSLF